MYLLTILVAAALFGVLGPWLMGRVDRFLDRGGYSAAEEKQDRIRTASPHRKSA